MRDPGDSALPLQHSGGMRPEHVFFCLVSAHLQYNFQRYFNGKGSPLYHCVRSEMAASGVQHFHIAQAPFPPPAGFSDMDM